MKALFAGSSLHGRNVDLADFVVRPFAAQGDVARAVLAGANVIGLVDGAFELTPSVWHKEILYALSSGVQVLGAASMGALRASECAAYGMVAVGRIANAYLAGDLDDDAAVALEFGPAELGSPPVTEALVDAEATLDRLLALGLIGSQTHLELRRRAKNLFFKDRTPDAMVEGMADADTLLALYREHRVSQKTLDALELVERMRALPDERTAPPSGWTFASSPPWRKALSELMP